MAVLQPMLRAHLADCRWFWAWALVGCAAAVGFVSLGVLVLAPVALIGWLVGFARDQHGTRATASGTCDGTELPASIDWSWGWSRSEPTLKVLEGHLYVDAQTVRVSFPGRKPKLIPVTDRFFLAALPRATRTPTKLEALDLHGHFVGKSGSG